MADNENINPRLKMLQTRFLFVGLAGIALAVVLGFFAESRSTFFQGYLLAFFFWNGLALGCMNVLMVHHIVAGGWGFVVQRGLEAGTRNLWWMPVLFAPMFYPLFTGDVNIWPWANEEYVAAHPVVAEKTAYLNTNLFAARWVLYYALWLVLVYFLNAWSKKLDETGDQILAVRLRQVSSIGLVIYVLSITFAATDWGMSIEPEWFSTIYPPIHIAGYALCALVFSILLLSILHKSQPHSKIMSIEYFNQLGGLTLGITIVWSYFSFSQFLIIWSGNLPEEIGFFLHRTDNALIAWATILILVHFAFPLLFLMQRMVKRNVKWLVGMAAVIFTMRFMDLTYLVKPSFVDNHNQFPLTLIDLALFAGIGGIWMSRFFAELSKRPLLPLNDERMPAALEHGLVGAAHEPEGAKHA
jgi:hypothetical protein